MTDGWKQTGTEDEPAGTEVAAGPVVFFEAAVVISLAASVLCLFLFVWLGREMRAGDTLRFDETIRNWVHQFASPGMTAFMKIVSMMGAQILAVELLIAFLVFARLRWKRAAFWLAIAMIGALVLEASLKYAYHRIRPQAYFVPEPASFSFPSGHSLTSFCFYGVLAGLLTSRIKSLFWRIAVWIAAAVLVVAIGLSRVYLGVHYPSDVLAGYLAATVWVGTIIVLDHVRKVRKGAKRTTLVVSMLLIICCMGVNAGIAQSTKSVSRHSSPIRVVSIRFSTGPGLCSICYCGSEIEVHPGSVTLLKQPFRECQQRDPQRFRDIRVDAGLSNKHWQELQRLVNHDALFGLPDTIGCPGCTDGLIQQIEVKFSDHTTKSVRYESAPAEISLLSEKLSVLADKLEKELPPLWTK